MKIYAYTMVWDTGFAPAVKNKVLSLACCKTRLRYKIAKELSDEEIYLVGICGKLMASRNRLEYNGYPVFIAKIDKAITTEEYFSSKSKYKNRPDAQYIFEEGKWYFTNKNPHHDLFGKEKKKGILDNPKEEKDLYYINKSVRKINYVLLSKEYVYFGKNRDVVLPESIKKIAHERELAWRSDLGVISSLTDSEKEEFKEFLLEYKDKFPSQDQNNTTDQYFITRTTCGERKCR